MKRRELIKLVAVFGMVRDFVWPRTAMADTNTVETFRSAWADWPDMLWAGPDYWGNRLQDWRITNGRVECLVAGRNRTLHLLTHRLGAAIAPFEVAVTIEHAAYIDQVLAGRAATTDCIGFRLGAKGPRDDYRSAAVYGTGLDVGITAGGYLRIGTAVGTEQVISNAPLRLRLRAEPTGNAFALVLSVADVGSDRTRATFRVPLVPVATLVGNIALVSHIDHADTDPASGVAVRFADWHVQGEKLVRHDADAFGPVCFAQYTLHRGTLKLTAQLAPIELAPGHRITVSVQDGNRWRTIGTPVIDPLSRTAHVRVDNWQGSRAFPYRVQVDLPVAGTMQSFRYTGTIAREPIDNPTLRLACFSCNADHGFPDADVVSAVQSHRVDAAVFLGDQFYESHGGFGIQRAPLEKSSLDMLRKWYMFGWSYRNLFRHVPSAMIPDDHDVYHGNIWGEGGVAAPTAQGWGYAAQDRGGYKMPPDWVNVVQRAQTSHLPDAFDATPVAQGIGVYYTHWNYAGVSFAILEDRKFKSAPSHVLPADARVVNGFATNPAFDLRQHYDDPNAQLLGQRQEQFLDQWGDDWTHGAVVKVVLSQTPFCAPHTLPVGSTSDEAVPTLPIPQPGDYVNGDAPIGDMDTNGWPANRRDAAVRLMRKARAFHVAGDQHLATVIQYGVDDFDDAGFVFTGPALNNIWPRRWWPTLAATHEPLPASPTYTGRFLDAFGNRLTMHAAANPRLTGREPAIIHDRVTGYGIVVFEKTQRSIRIECWPRGVDPIHEPRGQYNGWPITIQHSGERWHRVDKTE